jgi:hypothetical protein
MWSGAVKYMTVIILVSWLVVVVGLSTLGIMTVQNTEEATTFAAQVKDCQEQVIRALLARAKVSDVRNDLTERWLSALTEPPPDIAVLPDSDLQVYEMKMTRDYQAALVRLTAELRDHPIPNPQCGK